MYDVQHNDEAQHSSPTAAAIDTRDFLRAREHRANEAYLPDGTLVAVAGGEDAGNVNSICSALDRVKERHPDMVLVHGGGLGAPHARSPKVAPHQKMRLRSISVCSGSASFAASRRTASRWTSKPGSPRTAKVSRQPTRQSRAPPSESPNPRFGVPVNRSPKSASP